MGASVDHAGSRLIFPITIRIFHEHFQMFCFFVACILYAVFGSPTPDVLSIWEILIAALLFLSIGGHRSIYFLLYGKDHSFWMEVGRVFLVYGLIVTTSVSILRGASVVEILRDVIPFLFLFLPLFYDRSLKENSKNFLIILLSVVMIGVVFSFRSLVMRFPDFCFFWCTGELLYLENMPTVLFSALILNGYSFFILVSHNITIKIVSIIFVLMLIATIPFMAMVLSIQRASIGLWCTYHVFVIFLFLLKRPLRIFAGVILSVVLFSILGISADDIYFVFSEKNNLVGLNMRPQEFAAIWNVISQDWGTFLFGIGWGGHFYNPAVGGLHVNFTHNFFTSILLKSGLCGLILASLYIAMLLSKLVRLIQMNFVLGMAIFLPILIDLVLYASFKSLDFGLMLLMISAALLYFAEHESSDVESNKLIRQKKINKQMRRPNILFMNRVYPPVRGATGRVLRDLAHAFARDGWHVTVVTSGETAGQELDGNVRIVRVKGPQKPSNFLVYFWVWMKMLIIALRLKRRHLVVTLTDPPLMIVAGQIVAYFKKSKHINWCHDLYPDIMPALGYKLPDFVMRFLKRMSRKSMLSCEKVIVNGRCMAKHLAYDGIDPKMIAMIPNWPDLELIDPDIAESGAPVHHAFHNVDVEGMRPHAQQIKDGQRFRVLYSGNLGRAHTIDTILNAAEILFKENSDVEFVFVGDGKQFDLIAEQRAKRGLDNVRILPYQPVSRLREMMESGDVHLISMKDEAAGCLVPSKLYAALAVARPCIFIGPEQTEAAKVIQDFKTGVVVANGESEDLAEAIRIFRNDGQIWFAAHRGAARAREVFTPHESLDAWMERAFAIIKEDLKQVRKKKAAA